MRKPKGAKQAKQRQTKGKRGSVKITRGPRKGQTVQAYIYPNGKWSEIKGGKAGRVHAAGSGTKTLGKRARGRRTARKGMGVGDTRKLNQSTVAGRKTTRRLRRKGALPGGKRSTARKTQVAGSRTGRMLKRRKK